MLLSCSLVSCGEPIKSAENDPLFTATEPAANVPQGEMMIETAVSQRAYIAPTTTVTVKREKQEYRNVVITKKEILEAAGMSEVYLNYGYADVDAVSVNYGELDVLRDSDAYTIPEGYGLHYLSEIRVNGVPANKTLIISGSVFVKELIEEEYIEPEQEQSSAAEGDPAESAAEAPESQESQESKGKNKDKDKDKKKMVKVPKVVETSKFMITKFIA